MFWGKMMGQETSEPVWHSCSMSPAATAGACYFAGYSLAQAKVSWHFFTSLILQLLEKLCQRPECIDVPYLLWPTAPGATTHTFCSGAPLQCSPCLSYVVSVPVPSSNCVAVMPGHDLAGSWPVDSAPSLTLDLPCHYGLAWRSWECDRLWLLITGMCKTLAAAAALRPGLTLTWGFACQAWHWTYLVTTNCLGLQQASCLRCARLCFILKGKRCLHHLTFPLYPLWGKLVRWSKIL